MKSSLIRVCRILCISAILFLPTAQAIAKIQVYNFDWYIRHAELIVEAKIIGKDVKGGLTIFHAKILCTHFGKNEQTIDVAKETESRMEDEGPYFTVGNESIMFLTHGDGPFLGYYVCIGDAVGNIDFTGDTLGGSFFHFDVQYHSKTQSKTEFLGDLDRFVHVKTEINQDKKKALLIELLNNDNTFIITAACSYLNYLVNGEDKNLDWEINPPKSSTWYYQEYYDKNAMFQKAKWLKWWDQQNHNP